MKIRHILATAIIGVICTASLATAQEKLTVVADGELRILNNPIYPPMEFVNDKTGEMDGFDIDLAKAIANKLNLKPVFVKTSFSDLQSGIQTGRGDLILSGVTDTPARREAMDMVDYIVSGPVFFTMQKNADEIPEQADLCGKIVAGSRTSVALIKDVGNWNEENCVAKGKPALIYEGVADSNAARLGMKQGRYNAVAQGSETLSWLLQLEPDTYKVLGEPISKSSLFAIGIKKDNLQMREAIVDVLNQLIDDGSYAALLQKWSLQKNAIDKALVNRTL